MSSIEVLNVNTTRVNVHTYIHTYILTPWSGVFLEKLTGLQLIKKFPAFYGPRRFITPFTSACHLSLSSAISIQSVPPHLTSWSSFLILSSHRSLGLPSGSYPQVSPTKTLYKPLLSPIRVTCPAHLILLDCITGTIDTRRQRKIFSRRGDLATRICVTQQYGISASCLDGQNLWFVPATLRYNTAATSVTAIQRTPPRRTYLHSNINVLSRLTSPTVSVSNQHVLFVSPIINN